LAAQARFQASPQQRQQAAQSLHSWRLSQALGPEQLPGVEQAVKSKQKLAATNTTLVPVAKIGAI
jgi:hypothetical protein